MQNVHKISGSFTQGNVNAVERCFEYGEAAELRWDGVSKHVRCNAVSWILTRKDVSHEASLRS